MKCFQANLSSKVEGQGAVSTYVRRTDANTIINTIAIVSGILIIASSIACGFFLGTDLGLLSAILLSIAIVAGLLLIASGLFFFFRGIFTQRELARRATIEQERVLSLSQQLASTKKELESLSSLQMEEQKMPKESNIEEQNHLLQERSERIVHLESLIHQLRKEHAELLKEKDDACCAELKRQTVIRSQLEDQHQEEIMAREKRFCERLRILEDEISNQTTVHNDELTEIRKIISQNQEIINQEIREKEQKISDLQDSMHQQHDVDLDYIHELETLLREREEIVANLQSNMDLYDDLESEVNTSSLPCALIRIRQQKERIALLETINLQLPTRTRNRSSSI
ncbi:IncA family protein [Chlamydia felis]|nr:IncA family protein [Chlamydia felis]